MAGTPEQIRALAKATQAPLHTLGAQVYDSRAGQEQYERACLILNNVKTLVAWLKPVTTTTGRSDNMATGKLTMATDESVPDGLSETEQFFYKHAGWSYDPKTETAEQGRMRGAQILARAEDYATEHGWWYDVEPDPDVMDDDVDSVGMVARGEMVNLSVTLFGPPTSGEPLTRKPEVLGSLCGIVVENDCAPHLRVVAAELASEAIPTGEGDTENSVKFYALPIEAVREDMSTADGQDFLEDPRPMSDGSYAANVYTHSDDPDTDANNRDAPDCRMYQAGELVELAVFPNTRVDGSTLPDAVIASEK